MLTIKQIEKDGTERVFEALDIRRTKEGKLAFGSETIVESGKVYVMNDAGRTVAVYDFEKPQQ